MKNTLEVQKIHPEGSLSYTYSPLQNLLHKDENGDGIVGDFDTKQLDFDLKNIVTLSTVPSYDGSVDLILNDGKSNPKLINSRFSVLENGNYKFINRTQTNATNIYEESNLDVEGNLFLISDVWPKFKLNGVYDGGQLMGGNYTFYIRYCDEDGNESNIVSESKPVSIFYGNNPYNTRGTIVDERTNKLISFQINNLDTRYAGFYLYYTRNTSDYNGISMYSTYKLDNHYPTDNSTIVITGYEPVTQVSDDVINIQYNYYTSAKTHTTVQNMLFLGNVTSSANQHDPELQKLSYYIQVKPIQKVNVGYLDSNYNVSGNQSIYSQEYYSPTNIYNYVGYWPEEYYKFGIVYLFADGSTSPAFKLRGKIFSSLNELNYSIENLDIEHLPNVPYNKILNTETGENSGGVFKMPKVQVIDHSAKKVQPLGLNVTIPDFLQEELAKLGVIGVLLVRQNRIPTVLAQGLSVGIEENTHIPMLKEYNAYKSTYVTEAFIGQDGEFTSDYFAHKRTNLNSDTNKGLLCLDANVSAQLQNMFVYLDYELQQEYTCDLINSERHYRCINYKPENSIKTGSVIYVGPETTSKIIKSYRFSTKQGSDTLVYNYGRLGSDTSVPRYNQIVRGRYIPFLGTTVNLEVPSIYTIKVKQGLSDTQYVETLLNNTSEFFAVSDRYKLNETIEDIYSGDCFSNTVTVRLNYNFIDPETYGNDVIVTNKTWFDLLKDINNDSVNSIDGVDWTNVNRGDLNAIQLGTWVTYKCLSNYNLSLRSENKQNLDAISKLGNYSSFYPLAGISASGANKADESWLYNQGYMRTLPRKIYSEYLQTSYILTDFPNRIAFSNINATKMFASGYRVFQGVSYQDIDSSFGAIVKLLPYGQNLFCVFEHGCAVVPVNEKALLSTQEGQSIHLYGAGVLQEKVTVLSPDYGSMWADSILQTPAGFYGVDTQTKKIWKCDAYGFQIISDQKCNSFLNRQINLTESTKQPVVAFTNVKTHYNNFKGDVIFTFYNRECCWSLCYNERLQLWTTRYSWTPLLSDNIDNVFYSIDRAPFKAYTKLNTQNDSIKMKYRKIDENGNDVKVGTELVNPFIVNSGDIILAEYATKYTQTSQLEASFTSNNDFDYWVGWGGMIRNQMYIKIEFENTEYWHNLQTNQTYCKQTYNDKDYLVAIKSKYYNVSDLIDAETDNLDHKLNIEYFELPEVKGEMIKCLLSTNPLFVPKYNSSEQVKVLQINALCYILEEGLENGMFKIKFQITSVPEELFYIALNVNLKNNQNTSIRNYLVHDEVYFNKYQDLPIAQIYKHGYSGIFDAETISEPLQPTKWYGKQEPFEFEFVVNKPIGLHKIFDNLIMISNNVEPNSLEFEIEGDVYDFDKAGLFAKESSLFAQRNITTINNTTKYCKTDVIQDYLTGQYKLRIHQDCVNLSNGRRLGNIQYQEDSWKVVIQPIYYKIDIADEQQWKSTKVRDKYIKIRVKYNGEKLAIINAIHTIMSMSYV